MPDEKHPIPILFAFFDVLGTSKLVESKQIHKVYEMYDYITELMKKLHGGLSIGAVPDGADGYAAVLFYQNIHFAHFSDTFILWSEINAGPIEMTADSYTDDFSEPFLRINFPRFPPFVQTCMNVFCEALDKGIPLRGCISMGEAIMDKEKGHYVGEPLTESAKGEAAQKWIGVSFGESFFRAPCFDCKMLIPYTYHIKPTGTNKISNLAVDWPRYWREHKSGIDPIDTLNKLNDKPKFSDYYTNAIDFVRFSENNEKWWNKLKFKEIKNSEELIYAIEAWLNEYRQSEL